jgi:hypothetical protein
MKNCRNIPEEAEKECGSGPHGYEMPSISGTSFATLFQMDPIQIQLKPALEASLLLTSLFESVAVAGKPTHLVADFPYIAQEHCSDLPAS